MVGKSVHKTNKKGHKAYIWLSGTDGGIIASGTIYVTLK
jgi:hypothetical protein